jgi:glucose/arabinose dehydrogenase
MRSRVHISRRLMVEALARRELLAILPPGFSETPLADGLSNAAAMEFAPGGDLWVLEQTGAVKRFRPGSTTADVVGDVSTLGLSSIGERGLLGIAFDPAYATSKQVYLYYTATVPIAHNRVSRFTVNETNPADYFFDGASPSGPDAGATGTPTPTVVFDLDDLSSATNHNGGAIHFGPDGKLYVAVGDNANGANAQSLGNVLGKVLRMNSDGTAPADNPFFAATSGKQQTIWALGLRNPFTFAFQPGTGRMFINDVGQNTWEEIDDGIAGSNYGWPGIEGNQGTPPSGPGTYRPPVYTYSHGNGTFQGFAITGGAFYNPASPQFPVSFAGDYFFADYVSSWINVLDIPTGTVTRFATAAPGTVDLRVTNSGSLVYLARNDGQVLRVDYVANHPPTISAIANQTLEKNAVFAAAFTVGDLETAADNLILTASASNPALLPPGSLTFSGSGANRELQLTLGDQQVGFAAIRITVSDGSLTASTSFVVTVPWDEYPFHNPANGFDVDADGDVAAKDALLIINAINAQSAGNLVPVLPGPPPYFDVLPDHFLAPIDALLIINYINYLASQPTGGEGESKVSSPAALSVPSLNSEMLALLAMDTAVDPDRWAGPEAANGAMRRWTVRGEIR